MLGHNLTELNMDYDTTNWRHGMKVSYKEIVDLSDAVCDKLDFMGQNDQREDAKYKDLIALRDKLGKVAELLDLITPEEEKG